jgi:hypothetical protein
MATRLFLPFALALLGTAFAQNHSNAGAFRAAAVTRTGHLQFDAGVETVFPLFTPLGEKHWAKGWDPEILFPKDRDVAQGMVFRTREGVEHVWTLVRYDAANTTVAYNVVAEGVLVRQIQVRCHANGPARTEVEVNDSYISLSADGNAFIERLTEAAYEKKMAIWKEAIGGYLAGIAKPAK